MPKVTELYAYVVADTDEDDEGVPAFSEGKWLLPMMGADMERARSLRSVVEELATSSGKPIKLVRSTGLELVETIEPGA